MTLRSWEYAPPEYVAMRREEESKKKRTALEVAFEQAKGRELLNQLFEEPRDNEKT